jgi:hypothetical protein
LLRGKGSNSRSALRRLLLRVFCRPKKGCEIYFDSLLAKSDFSYDEAVMTN